MELCIQLAIIMVGKQAVNTLLEMGMPALWRWHNIVRTWKHTARQRYFNHLNIHNSFYNPLHNCKTFVIAA